MNEVTLSSPGIAEIDEARRQVWAREGPTPAAPLAIIAIPFVFMALAVVYLGAYRNFIEGPASRGSESHATTRAVDSIEAISLQGASEVLAIIKRPTQRDIDLLTVSHNGGTSVRLICEASDLPERPETSATFEALEAPGGSIEQDAIVLNGFQVYPVSR